MDHSTPGFPVPHHLPELAQIHVHRVSDGIQPSHPLLYPSPGFNLSQHQGLFQWVSSSGGQSIDASASASVLSNSSQGWFSLGLTGLISLLSQGLSRVFSRTTVQKHQFSGTLPSLWFNSYICIWLLEKPELWLHGPLSCQNVSNVPSLFWVSRERKHLFLKVYTWNCKTTYGICM